MPSSDRGGRSQVGPPPDATQGGPNTSLELPLPPLGRSGRAVIPIRRTFCGLLPSQSRDQDFISHAILGSGWPLPGGAPHLGQPINSIVVDLGSLQTTRVIYIYEDRKSVV